MSYVDTNDLFKYSIKAQDGDIGKVHDMYFDEELFYLRYLVVNTETFLLRNLVLVSPLSFHKINPANNCVDLYITKSELENSPSLDSAETVSRQYEKAYNDYFSWPYYWKNGGASAWAVGPYGIPWGYYDLVGRDKAHIENKKEFIQAAQENGLRSVRELESYSIQGIDDKFGHIEGFIVDTLSLSLEFVIVDTINYLPAKHVLLRPEWIENISWHEKSVHFPFFKELIQSAPAYANGDLNNNLIQHVDNHFKPALKIKQDTNELTNLNNEENQFMVKKERAKLVDNTNEKVAVGDIPSGLFIITTEDSKTKKPKGFLASWVQQASFDPLLVSVCIKEGRPGLDSILKEAPFCINVISVDKNDSLVHFSKHSTTDTDPFDKVPHQILTGKGAVLDDAKSVMVCKPYKIFRPGDHWLIMAEVVDGVIIDKTAKSMTHVRRSAAYY